jgi:prepilin-type processing-associated H-X9-DG protein
MAARVAPNIWGETFAAWRQQPSTTEGRTWFVSMSYGFNPFLTYPDDPAGREQHWGHCNIRRAANVPVIFDSLHIAPAPESRFSPPEYEGQIYHWFGAVCINRHNQATNMLFLDWSVRRVGIKEHWTLKWGPLSDTAGPWTKTGGVLPADWPQWMRRFKDY